MFGHREPLQDHRAASTIFTKAAHSSAHDTAWAHPTKAASHRPSTTACAQPAWKAMPTPGRKAASALGSCPCSASRCFLSDSDWKARSRLWSPASLVLFSQHTSTNECSPAPPPLEFAMAMLAFHWHLHAHHWISKDSMQQAASLLESCKVQSLLLPPQLLTYHSSDVDPAP